MDLLPLAIRANQDRTARGVLGDAVLESGWADERVTWMLRTPHRWKWEFRWDDLHRRSKVRSQTRARNLSRKHARRPTSRWCRAVLAALLFDAWSAEMWPAAERCQRPRRDWGDYLQRMYSQAGISQMMYEENPLLRMIQKSGVATVTGIDRATPAVTFDQAPGSFFNLNRIAEPQRLAGVRLIGSDVVLDDKQVNAIMQPPRRLSMHEQIVEARRLIEEIQNTAPPEPKPGALAEMWEREIDATLQSMRRRGL